MSTPVSLAIKPPGAKKKSAWNAPSQQMFHDDSDEEGDAFASASGSRRQVKAEREDEEIKGFGANGRALGSRRSPEPLVIPSLPNRDWREAAANSAQALGQRRAPNYRPERRDTGPVVTHERVGDEPQRRGIRKAGDFEEGYDVKPDAVALAAASTFHLKEEMKEEKEDEDVKPGTLDEEALAAVLAGETHAARVKREEDLVISSGADTRLLVSEDQALERDLNILPSESTLEDYDAVPVEAFGAAMLRGMGYDPKNDTPMHVPKPRPALLGIGATALSSELPPTRHKDPKKRREAAATRGGRGFNAAALLVKNGDSRGTSRETSAAGSAVGSRAASPGEKRRRDDDDGRDGKRRYDERDRERSERRGEREDSKRRDGDERDRKRDRPDDRDRRDRDRDRDRDQRRYETDEERAARKARERERERDGGRDRRDDRRDDDRRRDRDRDRDRERERERERDSDRYRRDDRDRRDSERDRR